MPMASNLFGSGRTDRIACAAGRHFKMQCSVVKLRVEGTGELAPAA